MAQNTPDATYLTAKFPPTLRELADGFALIKATNVRCEYLHVCKASWEAFKAGADGYWDDGHDPWIWGAEVIDLAPEAEVWLYGEVLGSGAPYTVRMRVAVEGEIPGTVLRDPPGPPPVLDPEHRP